jgi:uncharacterized protein (DUF2252 family)
MVAGTMLCGGRGFGIQTSANGQEFFRLSESYFFRWAKQIEALCAELETAPRVLSVGDTHTENFGT